MTLTAAQQDSAAAKVLRRAEISRITRLLKSRLTLASYKTSRGWQNLALDSIAPRLTEERVFAAPLHKRPRTAPDDALHTAWAGALRLHQSSPAHRSGAYNPCSTHYESRSSPPQTPPRTRPPPTGEEGVDLLIYLATSPHASVGARFVPHTPQNFDLADFVNITPSPAQAAWTRTPGSARRRLTYDAPSATSPALELGEELAM